jgi:molybdate/tungstate transport system substrate-binding protein
MRGARTSTSFTAALVLAALALSVSVARAPARQIARRASKGKVSVIYAGSLVAYMEDQFGPSFEQSSGYAFRGFGGGSTEDASEIKGGVRVGDVFVSASASADGDLEGKANGNWVSWYSTFAASPLVLGYDPSSSYGAELAHGKPWYEVLTQPGILVGRTEPQLDPKGVLTVEAIDNAAAKLHDPKLKSALSSFPVYLETALVGRLQSGQLDAGFFYSAEAATAHIPTVSLKPVFKYALYTITILNRDPDPAGAAALVRYLLSSTRRYALKHSGFEPLKPKFSGHAGDVPKSLRAAVGAG